MVFQREELPYFYDTLHFHKAIQMSVFLKGSGTCFIGERLFNFEPGDIFLIGSNTAHVFRCHTAYYQNTDLRVAAETLFINPSILEKSLFLMPESTEIAHFLTQMQKGIYLRNEIIAQKISNFENLSPFESIIQLLALLNEIHLLPNKQFLNQTFPVGTQKEITYERINKVLEYSLRHFTQEIKLKEVAALINMTPTAFCKYFKQRTRQSYVDFLNDIRINHATVLLKKTDQQIQEIALASGFNNLANFNRQFSKRKKHSPGRWRSVVLNSNF